MNDANQLLRRFILALTVWREARGESPRGKLLVAQVIENRVQDKRWPDTYVGVATQRMQFSSFNRNDPNAYLFPAENDTTWAESVTAADSVLSATSPFTQANHYHVIGLDPAWRDDTKVVASEGHHVFYQL